MKELRKGLNGDVNDDRDAAKKTERDKTDIGA